MHKTAYEMRISDWSSDVCSSACQRIAQPFMQVGRDPIGPVGFDRAQCIYDLADRHVAVDRAHPTPFERRRETIDMDRAQVADAGQLQSFVGKPGAEVTIDLDRKSVVSGQSES